MQWKKRGLSRGFEEVKDLVRGTIVAEVGQLWQAYEHFSNLEGVEVVEIKSVNWIMSYPVYYMYKSNLLSKDCVKNDKI